TIECLSGVLNYAKQIISIPDKIRLKELLNPDDDYTEFFDNGYHGMELGLSLEVIKQLVQIYLLSYLSIIKILINDEISRDKLISRENTHRMLIDTMELSKDFAPSVELVDCTFNLYVNNDNDLINFMNNVLQLSVQLKKLANLPKPINLPNETELKWFIETISSHFGPFLQYCTPHTLFLRFLQSIGFEHSTILDFLISNETQFLEFFGTYCKYLEQDVEEFRIECYKFEKKISKVNSSDEISIIEVMNEDINEHKNDNLMSNLRSMETIDHVNEVFCNLREVIQSLMDKQLFPYNASSLVKRIKKVEEILIV
ncbi:9723_t:CDS:2, partial [Scutellospora calospora]